MNIEDWYLKVCELLPKDGIVYSLDEWGGEVPWTMMLSMLGKVTAREIEVISESDKSELFKLVGLSMREGDEFLSTAVATGFLEALYMEAVGDEKIMKELSLRLDDASLDYLRKWTSWSQDSSATRVD